MKLQKLALGTLLVCACSSGLLAAVPPRVVDLTGVWTIDVQDSHHVGFGLSRDLLDRNIRERYPKLYSQLKRPESEEKTGLAIVDTSEHTAPSENLLPITSAEKLEITFEDDSYVIKYGDSNPVTLVVGKTEFSRHERTVRFRRTQIVVNTQHRIVSTKEIYSIRKNQLLVEVRVTGLGEFFRRNFRRVYDRVPQRTIIEEEL